MSRRTALAAALRSNCPFIAVVGSGAVRDAFARRGQGRDPSGRASRAAHARRRRQAGRCGAAIQVVEDARERMEETLGDATTS